MNTNTGERRLMRLKDILPLFGITKSGWYKAIRNGRIARPIKIGRVSVWEYSYIQELLESIIKNKGTE